MREQERLSTGEHTRRILELDIPLAEREAALASFEHAEAAIETMFVVADQLRSSLSLLRKNFTIRRTQGEG